jgi:hypothetical protein
MSTVTGTIKEVNLVQGATNGLGARKTYLVTANFAVYTASSDSGALAAVNTAIADATKNGKTITLRQAMGAGPGKTNVSGAAVYALNVTVSGATLTFDLGGTTAEADTPACSDVGFFVSVDES